MAAVAQNLHQVMPKQHRSRARRDALLAHGADILNRRDLDEVSIAEITGGLGYSTGSFYSYFRDKSAFFVAVQLWVAEEQDRIIAATLAPRDMAALGIADRLSACVDYVIPEELSRWHLKTEIDTLRHQLKSQIGKNYNLTQTMREKERDLSELVEHAETVNARSIILSGRLNTCEESSQEEGKEVHVSFLEDDEIPNSKESSQLGEPAK